MLDSIITFSFQFMKWSIKNASGFSPHRLLKLCLIFALLLTTLMAVTSDENRHPDEFWHFAAAKYYTNHFLPPEIGDSSVRDSYSVFGVSYLNYHWAEYFLAGKFALLISPIISSELLAARLFNVFLFFCLIVLFLCRSKNNNQEFIIACFLLVTPQIWYIFSYANNDAFALFISLLIAYQIAYKKSLFNAFLEAQTFFTNISGGIFFGFLIGLLLIAKTNFYTFLLFIALWLALDFSASESVSEKPTARTNLNSRLFKKYLLIVLTAISVLTFRCALDFYANGETNFVAVSYLNYFSGSFEKKQSKLLAYQEEIAEKPYKPSTIENNLEQTDPSLKLKAKGASYTEIFSKWRWHEISFKSYVGVYGYMKIFASDGYYRLMGILYFAFGSFLIFSIALSKRPKSLVQAAIFTTAAGLTVYVSTYLSWTYAFQAQGRYLFPVIGMLGLFVFSNRRHLNNLATNAFILSAFLLSVYSFIFVALPKINQ